ncbi:uroporphyrinogen decarboxylase family protein [Thermodesulfobacteriota bacterium]
MAKTEEALTIWCSAKGIQFINTEAEEEYKKRAQRIADAIQIKIPDRVPIAPHVTFFSAKYKGLSMEETMSNYEKSYEAYRETVLEFQWDVAPTHIMAYSAPFFEAIDYKQLQWPGHNIPRNRPYQFIEKEYMTADEYDHFLDDSSDFIIRKYLPRVSGKLSKCALLPPITMFIPYYMGLFNMFGAASAIGIDDDLGSIVKAIEEFRRFAYSVGSFFKEMNGLGFPTIIGGRATQAPFDTIGDSLRGTQGIMLDMYRKPESLIKAMEKILPDAINMAVARPSPCPIAFIPLHKGAMGFMSIDQFKTFYWPTLHKLMLALIEHGLVPMLLIESDYTDRLEIIKDIPAGKVIYWFERTDIFKAKEILGDHVCIKGNVPSSLLCTGTPDEVKVYCKKLIDVVGKGGGLIVDGDIGIPDEAKPDNVMAMTEFGKEYGVYS